MVTIITPLHNKGAYVAETLNSIISQTYQDWEVLVVENHSSDEGPAVAKKYSSQDRRIRFIEAPIDVKGPGAARNFAFQFAKGDWILYLDADDKIKPSYLHQMLEFSKINPEFDMLVAPWRLFQDDGYVSSLITHEVYGKSKIELLVYSIARVPWHICSALIKRRLINESSWAVSMDKLIAEDGAFWFPIINSANVGWTDIDGALYMVGLPSSRGNSSDSLKWALGMQETVELNLRFLQNNGLEPVNEQCIACMDVFEERYWICYRTKATKAESICLYNANKWFKKIKNNNTKILLRKIFGIKKSLIIEKIFLRILNKTNKSKVSVFKK